MSSSLVRKILGVLLSAFLLSVAYYGSYLPLHKSQMFITALRNLRNIKSLADFEQSFSLPLDAPSPVGQEELVRNTANTVLGLMQQQGVSSQIAAELMKYVQNYYAPLIDRGRGMSFEQNLYLLGALNEIMYTRTGDAKYLQAADKYYSEGLQFGPKRPQFLYGLFDVYRMEGNIVGVQAIAQQILSQWPDDQRTRSALADYLASVSSSRPQ